MLSPQLLYYVHQIVISPIPLKPTLPASLIPAFSCKSFLAHFILLVSFPKRSLKPNEIILHPTKSYSPLSNPLRNGATFLKALLLPSKFGLIINHSEPSSPTNSYLDDKLIGPNSYPISTSQLNIYLENEIELMVFLGDLTMIHMAYILNYRNHFSPPLYSLMKSSHFLPWIS